MYKYKVFFAPHCTLSGTSDVLLLALASHLDIGQILQTICIWQISLSGVPHCQLCQMWQRSLLKLSILMYENKYAHTYAYTYLYVCTWYSKRRKYGQILQKHSFYRWNSRRYLDCAVQYVIGKYSCVYFLYVWVLKKSLRGVKNSNFNNFWAKEFKNCLKFNIAC